jgi:asparagine synthase (glutamine-hydrolysing)
MIEELPLIVAAQEEPFGSASIVAQWFVMKAAREAGIKVMLDGQGGDEIFAGYLTSFGPRFADLVLGGHLREFTREAQAFRRIQGAGAGDVATALVRGALPERIVDRVRGRRSGASRLVHADLRSLGRPLGRPASNGRNAMPTRLQRHLEELLLRRQLPELLRYEDRNSMAHSIEARVPLLDYRLVELLFSLDARVLIEGGRTKILLRRAFADILPPAVRDRTDKIGFAAPQAWWLLGPLGELAANVFASDSFRQRGFVDAEAASARLERHRQGDVAAGFEVWRALVVELWAQAHFR